MSGKKQRFFLPDWETINNAIVPLRDSTDYAKTALLSADPPLVFNPPDEDERPFADNNFVFNLQDGPTPGEAVMLHTYGEGDYPATIDVNGETVPLYYVPQFPSGRVGDGLAGDDVEPLPEKEKEDYVLYLRLQALGMLQDMIEWFDAHRAQEISADTAAVFNAYFADLVAIADELLASFEKAKLWKGRVE